jgi:hypothetical protein
MSNRYKGELVEIDFGAPYVGDDSSLSRVKSEAFAVSFTRGAVGLHCATPEEVAELTAALSERGLSYAGFMSQTHRGSLFVLAKG